MNLELIAETLREMDKRQTKMAGTIRDLYGIVEQLSELAMRIDKNATVGANAVCDLARRIDERFDRAGRKFDTKLLAMKKLTQGVTKDSAKVIKCVDGMAKRIDGIVPNGVRKEALGMATLKAPEDAAMSGILKEAEEICAYLEGKDNAHE